MTPEEYVRVHQKAFRTAFDFLNSHFPPQKDNVWWEQAARECSACSVAAGEGTLVIELLTAVMNYLGEEYRERGMQDGSAEN